MIKHKKPNYLKFILITFGVIFITFTLLAMTSKTSDIKTDQLSNILNNFKTNENITSSNLLSLVKETTLTEPTINQDSPVLGPVNAPITIFEFSCYGCPASRDMQPILKQILNKYPEQVKLIWKDLPLPDLYPQADLAHLASRCAGEQNKFWQYHDLLWQNQNNFSPENLQTLADEINLDNPKFTDCINSKKFQNLIDADVDEAAQLSISGTPHFYINNQEIFGIVTLEDFELVINAELNR